MLMLAHNKAFMMSFVSKDEQSAPSPKGSQAKRPRSDGLSSMTDLDASLDFVTRHLARTLFSTGFLTISSGPASLLCIAQVTTSHIFLKNHREGNPKALNKMALT
ncbi:hypothetical protein ACP275_04G157000 [Erythranthe tilingii]